MRNTVLLVIVFTVCSASASFLPLPVGTSVGGTGQTTFTNGQILIGNTTGNTLTKATLTEGSGITITNGSGSITVASVGGTYTPTATSIANLDSTPTPAQAMYVRSGTTVCVSGRASADPTTTATNTDFELTLPISSNLGTADLSGDCTYRNDSTACLIEENTSTDKAFFRFIPVGVTAGNVYYNYCYEVN